MPPPEHFEPWSPAAPKPEAWSKAQLTTVPVGSFAPVYAMICPLAEVGVPPVRVIVVVTEERAAEVVPIHSSMWDAQLVGLIVWRAVAWNVIPGAEGGVEVDTVIDCGSVTTTKMITSEAPDVVSPVIVNVLPDVHDPTWSGPLPESSDGLEPITTFCDVPVSAVPELVDKPSHFPPQPETLELPR